MLAPHGRDNCLPTRKRAGSARARFPRSGVPVLAESAKHFPRLIGMCGWVREQGEHELARAGLFAFPRRLEEPRHQLERRLDAKLQLELRAAESPRVGVQRMGALDLVDHR